MKKTPPEPVPHFHDLGISPEILTVLERVEYHHPTAVQHGFIPLALQGRDVIGQARTGTGKTAAFAIPMWERFKELNKVRRPRGLVLVPTRELAAQVYNEIQRLAPREHLHAVSIVGGERLRGQELKLRSGTHIVVGTPGRVIDMIKRHILDLSKIEVLVLDEADRMLDIGFRPDIEYILKHSPKERQTFLLSATMPPPIQRLAQRYMKEPEHLDCSQTGVGNETIEQSYFTVAPNKKFELLCRLLMRERPKQAIVFCRTKRRTDEICRRLSEKLKGVGMMHGDMRQTERNRVMTRFRQGQVCVLVATDVVGRGIDVTGISHIINYDVPEDSDDYVHRVGRTGRMGRDGISFTFVTLDEGDFLTRIEMRIDRL
ncbi:MAG TPA: DEAD/DEAH box helicase, partial [Pirellulaceae bacterium]